ncbi:MAG TPA: GNAT family N-acetyltransferase [Pyrinomonadaceae bacterium]|jgi:GNAT superfamily N-acetyltransferase|nr:GNAT family N-acetyltransferase [Pyrinomonadaceae bacterium]
MIAIAGTDSEIEDCYAVMAELRPQISFDDFLPRVKRLSAATGFRLVYLKDAEEEVKAVGGFRISEWLAGGKYLEIEDLATKEGARSKGYGGEIFDWLVEFAVRAHCDQLRLVSHVKRFAAHRFYLRKGMIIEAHYFSMPLK